VHFGYPCTLSLIHYAITLAGICLLRDMGAFKPREKTPMTPRLWMLSLVVGVAPGINNISLELNSVGFYTVAKLMVSLLQ
jgi:hypothetical protein